jgi:beta-galactosidase
MADQVDRFDLGGEWQLILDPDCVGLKHAWAQGSFPVHHSFSVEVPSLWNLTHPYYEGVAFYRKMFHAPALLAGKVALIHFEGVCYRAEAWINGRYLGSHEGAYTPFWFDVTPWLLPGKENELVLRVASLSKTKPVDGILLKHVPASKQSWYYTHGGPWGKVWLESRPWVYIQSLVLEPDLRRENVRLEVALNNRLCEVQKIQLVIQVNAPSGQQVGEVSTNLFAPPGLAKHSFLIPVPRPLAWSCDKPYLYHVRVEVTSLHGGVNVKEGSFGMRDFTVHDGQFFLNGEPVFLKGILLQPHYPVTLMVPPDPEMMLQEITLVKEAGFNMIRSHVRPAPPGYLDITDRLGIMVYAETSLAWIRTSPRLLEHGEREIRELIERDRNHPSVVIWGILEENPPASAEASEHFMSFARALDPTRVILDNSGGSLTLDQDFGWLDRAHVLPARESMKEKILDIHAYLGNIISSGAAEWLRNLGNGAPFEALLREDLCTLPILEEFERESRTYTGKIFISEIGGAGMMDLEAALSSFASRTDLIDAHEISVLNDSLVQGFSERKLEHVFGPVGDMIADSQILQARGVTRQLEALLCNPRISGFVLTQLNDVGWEFHAGILDMWRNPKQVYQELNRLNSPHCLVIRAASQAVTWGDRVPVNITLVKRTGHPSTGQVVVEATGPDLQIVASCRLDAPGSEGIHELGAVVVDTSHIPGVYNVSARLDYGGEQLATATETFTALPFTSLKDVMTQVVWIGKPDGLQGEESCLFLSYPVEPRPADGNEDIIIAPFPSKLSLLEWASLLEAVNGGGVAVIGPLHPRDTRALQELHRMGIDLNLELGIGSWIGCYHWIPTYSPFEGLPNSGFAGEAYIDLQPHYSFREIGGEIMAGAIRSKYTVDGASEFFWYSDIESLPFGRGKLIFCQYRIFDNLASHPISRRLFANLIQYVLNRKEVCQSPICKGPNKSRRTRCPS